MSTEPTLRRAGPDDAAAVRELTLAAYARWVPVIGREPRPMGADYERAVREHAIDLLEEAGTLLALVEMMERADDVLIVNVAVHPAHQGRGFGRRLLDHAEAVAVGRGTPTLRLYTNARFAENLALYASRGFVAEREEDNEFGRVVHMVKNLASAATAGLSG